MAIGLHKGKFQRLKFLEIYFFKVRLFSLCITHTFCTKISFAEALLKFDIDIVQRHIYLFGSKIIIILLVWTRQYHNIMLSNGCI